MGHDLSMPRKTKELLLSVPDTPVIVVATRFWNIAMNLLQIPPVHEGQEEEELQLGWDYRTENLTHNQLAFLREWGESIFYALNDTPLDQLNSGDQILDLDDQVVAEWKVVGKRENAQKVSALHHLWPTPPVEVA